MSKYDWTNVPNEVEWIANTARFLDGLYKQHTAIQEYREWLVYRCHSSYFKAYLNKNAL